MKPNYSVRMQLATAWHMQAGLPIDQSMIRETAEQLNERHEDRGTFGLYNDDATMWWNYGVRFPGIVVTINAGHIVSKSNRVLARCENSDVARHILNSSGWKQTGITEFTSPKPE